MDEQSKWQSRKLFVTLLQFTVLMLLPPIYKSFEISETVLMTVLSATSALSALYLGANVMAKKYEGDKE